MQPINLLQWIKKFLSESLQRFTTKSPFFFKVINIICAIPMIITGLPALLAQIGITELPDWFTWLQNKNVAFAALAGFIVSLLTTQSKVIGITEDGEAVKKSNEKLLPFTSAKETKTAIKNEVPNVEIKPTTSL